uniref:Putative secreted protein n=1 Tax=Amblyomma triste TaxID=251400 RepID=A0A023G1G9_AMBTT
MGNLFLAAWPIILLEVLYAIALSLQITSHPRPRRPIYLYFTAFRSQRYSFCDIKCTRPIWELTDIRVSNKTCCSQYGSLSHLFRS